MFHPMQADLMSPWEYLSKIRESRTTWEWEDWRILAMLILLWSISTVPPKCLKCLSFLCQISRIRSAIHSSISSPIRTHSSRLLSMHKQLGPRLRENLCIRLQLSSLSQILGNLNPLPFWLNSKHSKERPRCICRILMDLTNRGMQVLKNSSMSQLTMMIRDDNSLAFFN